MALTVRRVGSDSAHLVLDIIREAFSNRPALDPPADALSDTEASISTRLALNGGLVARIDDDVVGALLFDPVGDTMYLRRVGIRPAAQGHGVSSAMVAAAVEAAAPTHRYLAVVAREELPRTIAFWRHRGFVQSDRRTPYVEMVRPLPTRHRVSTPEAMRALGGRVAGALRGGDLVVLSGDLGAGKTTFTQGLGAALRVEGRVTSPTFVIAREHAATTHRPGLVHVDAYRLGDAAELDDLDLDSALEDVVTVVEWGEGKVEALADSRLHVSISREPVLGAEPLGPDEDAEPRVVELTGLGPRWATSWPVVAPERGR